MRRPTAKEQRQLRRFFWSDRRGLSPAHFAINATLFLVAGLIVVADGYIVVGLLIVAFVAFCGYATVLRWRGSADRQRRVRSARRRS
jgi:Flp pilus assembly protein TadB